MTKKWILSFGPVGLAVALGLAVLLQAPLGAAEAAARPYLGIMAEPSAQEGTQTGVVVRQVSPDSPAAKAGLKDGDVILKADDKEVKDIEALTHAVTSHKAGDKLQLHVRRDGKEQDLTVTVADRPVRRGHDLGDFQAEKHAFLGVQSQPLTPELKDHLGVAADHGVVVTDVVPNTPAAKAGLKSEDVITAVGDKAINKPEELRDAIRQADIGKEVTLKVTRGKEHMELKTKLESMPMGLGALPPELERQFPGFTDRFPTRMPMFESAQRVQELEAKVKELEKRLHELEQKQSK